MLTPGRHQDLGEGKGRAIRARLVGGEVGILLDGRGRRPFGLPENRDERIRLLDPVDRGAGCLPGMAPAGVAARPNAPVMAG